MIFNFILDVCIFVLLLVTIIFAARLSLGLKRFRDSKGELEAVITDLSKQVERANKAIDNMKKTADNAGRDLQRQIDFSVNLIDELQIIIESGDSVAQRIEMLVDKSKKTIDGEQLDLDALEKIMDNDVEQIEKKDVFSIHDREAFHKGQESAQDFELNDLGDTFSGLSESERDLHQALNKKRKKKAGS